MPGSRTCADALRMFPELPDAPAHCEGPIEWVLRGYNRRSDDRCFCAAHGAFHAALSPLAGYRRIEPSR